MTGIVIFKDSNIGEKRIIIRDGRTLRALSNKGFFTYPVTTGHKYIDEGDQPRRFEYKGKQYSIEYGDGCFFPFLFEIRTAIQDFTDFNNFMNRR